MSPSQAFWPPTATLVLSVLMVLSGVFFAVMNWLNARRSRQLAVMQLEIKEAVESAVSAWQVGYDELKRSLMGRIGELEGELQELRGIRAELRRHATSNLLHPERVDAP